ncbi:hypothetical protein BDC45DRAFT_593819 [Circinella umbellata]|nr:hypothetical protein BDC45DRAFT_593819 [Circinella umbellata]
MSDEMKNATPHQRDQFLDQLIQKIKSACDIHSQRSLSISGRATIVNVLILSTLWHVLQVCPVPKSFFEKVRSVCHTFLTRRMWRKVAYYKMVDNRNKGGLAILHPSSQQSALQLRWIIPLFNHQDTTKSFIHDWIYNIMLQWSDGQDPLMVLLFPYLRTSTMRTNRFVAILITIGRFLIIDFNKWKCSKHIVSKKDYKPKNIMKGEDLCYYHWKLQNPIIFLLYCRNPIWRNAGSITGSEPLPLDAYSRNCGSETFMPERLYNFLLNFYHDVYGDHLVHYTNAGEGRRFVGNRYFLFYTDDRDEVMAWPCEIQFFFCHVQIVNDILAEHVFAYVRWHNIHRNNDGRQFVDPYVETLGSGFHTEFMDCIVLVHRLYSQIPVVKYGAQASANARTVVIPLPKKLLA